MEFPNDIITPNLCHLDPEERAGIFETVLEDLHLLAVNNGCIASAVAHEILEGLLKGTITVVARSGP